METMIKGAPMTELNVQRTRHDPEFDGEGLLTVRDVALLLSIHPRPVWRMASSGELPQPLRFRDKLLRWRGGIR